MSYQPNPYNQYPTSEMYGSNPPTPHSQQQEQQDPPGAYPQWATLEHPQQLEHQDLPLHSPLETTPVPTPTSTNFNNMQLELDDPPHMVPSHQSPIDDTPILLHHPNEPPPMQHSRHMDPLLFRPPSTGPSGATTLASGVVRSTASRGRAAATHPYGHYRASTGAAVNPVGPSSTSSSGSSSRIVPPRKTSVRFSGTTAHGGMLARPMTRSTSAMQSPAVPSPTTRVGYFGGSNTSSPQTQQHHSFSPQAQDPNHTPQTPQPHHFPHNPATQTQGSPVQSSHLPARARRSHASIPSDMHYSETENTLTASLELPGVTADNLRVTLGTCYFNHIKYVGITAESVPPFGPPEWSAEVLQAVRAEMEKGLVGAAAAGIQKLKVGRIVNPNLRERRFGIMRRMIQVPGHTTMNDIAASLKDGVLTLRIHCGKPFEQDDEQEVPVRFG